MQFQHCFDLADDDLLMKLEHNSVAKVENIGINAGTMVESYQAGRLYTMVLLSGVQTQAKQVDIYWLFKMGGKYFRCTTAMGIPISTEKSSLSSLVDKWVEQYRVNAQ